MSVKDMNYRERGLLLSMFAHQCYSEPKNLLKKRPGIKDLAPLKKFLNKPLPPTFIDVDGAQAYVMSDSKNVLITCRGTEPTELIIIKAAKYTEDFMQSIKKLYQV